MRKVIPKEVKWLFQGHTALTRQGPWGGPEALALSKTSSPRICSLTCPRGGSSHPLLRYSLQPRASAAPGTQGGSGPCVLGGGLHHQKASILRFMTLGFRVTSQVLLLMLGPPQGTGAPPLALNIHPLPPHHHPPPVGFPAGLPSPTQGTEGQARP